MNVDILPIGNASSTGTFFALPKLHRTRRESKNGVFFVAVPEYTSTSHPIATLGINI
jgi:hypothetical protein